MREREEKGRRSRGGSRKEALGLRLGVDFGVPSTPRAKERAKPRTGTGNVEGECERARREGKKK